MKSLAAVHTAPIEFNLTILSGKDKGVVYKLMASEITLGRGTDNDISFPDDPTCSRRHAKISLTPEGFRIEGLSDKNSIIVNGKQTSSAILLDGSNIELGNTTLKFNVVKNQVLAPPHLAAVPGGGLQHAAHGDVARSWNPQSPHPSPASPRRRGPKPKTITPIRMIIGIVAILGLYLALADNPTVKKKMVELRTNESIAADIEAAKKLTESTMLEKRKGQTQTQAYKEAQGAYVRGFRDHQKGIYGRAMESFQACLSLAPDHVLCNRYLRLSQRRFNELTQYHMVLGRKYKDQNQFTACASAFSNVMVMIKDQNNKTYQEAKANYDACHIQVEGRF